MRSFFVAAVFSALLVQTAHAQSVSEKRRAHLPSVRAAANCLASAILNNQTASIQAESGRWYDALLLINDCRNEIQQMIFQHDLIFGGGGEDFFKGPYLADLPRALSARIKPELDRRAAVAAEKQRADQQAILERERAKKDQEAARDELLRNEWSAHRKCINDALVNILPNSNENAEIITTAIVSLCRSHESKLLNLAMALYGMSSNDADAAVSKGINNLRADIIKEIVIIRAAAHAAKNKNSSQNNDAVVNSPNKERSF